MSCSLLDSTQDASLVIAVEDAALFLRNTPVVFVFSRNSILKGVKGSVCNIPEILSIFIFAILTFFCCVF